MSKDLKGLSKEKRNVSIWLDSHLSYRLPWQQHPKPVFTQNISDYFTLDGSYQLFAMDSWEKKVFEMYVMALDRKIKGARIPLGQLLKSYVFLYNIYRINKG